MLGYSFLDPLYILDIIISDILSLICNFLNFFKYFSVFLLLNIVRFFQFILNLGNCGIY